MPTAGEYKHEPTGIPCHCYVKRRLHHSTCKKSCLRKQFDSSCQYNDTKSKKVTFNPILSVRSYENLPSPKELDTKPFSNTCKHPADPIKSHHHDYSSSNNTATLCNKLTSLFYLNQKCRSSNDTKNPARPSSKYTHCKEHNNITDQGDKMRSKKFCPFCESKRNKSPVRDYHYQKTSERSPSPSGFHQYLTPNVSETLRSQKRTNSSRATPIIPTNSKYHVPRQLFRRDSISNSSEETSTQEDTSAGYENMNTDLDGSSVCINGDADKIPRPVSIFTKGDREEDKFAEYIYENLANNTSERAEYDYMTINNTKRPKSDSQNPIGSTFSITRLIKHKTEANLTSASTQDFTLHPKLPVPRSAPNLQSIMSTYDSRFDPIDHKHVETYTPFSTLDKSQRNTHNTSPINNSPLIDILKMTPIAFFWTGCAFLMAIVYIFLFSCLYEHDN